MSKVYILGKRKENTAKSAFKKVISLFTGIMMSIVMFAMIDNSGYLFLLQHNTSVGSVVLDIMQTISRELGISSDGSSAIGQQGVSELLISKMQEGYAKDYLKIALENQKGELDTKEHEVYASVKAAIGVNVSETQFYDWDSHPYTLPTSDIPVKYIKDGSYGTGNITLYNWSNSTATDHYTDRNGNIGGAFRYTSNGWTGINTKSKYNKGSSTPKGIGDAYLFPDAVCGLNDFLATGIKELKVDSSKFKASAYYEENCAMICGFMHNAGSGVLSALYGLPMYDSSDCLGDLNSDETMQRLDGVAKDILTGVNGLSDDAMSEYLSCSDATQTWTTSEICLISQGWYIDEHMYKHLCTYHTQSIKAWNWFFPDEKVSSESELEKKLEKYKKSLSEVTGYSPDECDKIYGTKGGSWHDVILNHPGGPYTSQAQYGVVFKKLDGTTNLKNSKSAVSIVAFSGIPMWHMFAALAVAPKTYERMLAYAGVDITTIQAANTNASAVNPGDGEVKTLTFSANTEALNTLQSHGCNTKRLDKSRYKILVAAMKMEGSQYVWGGGHDSCSSLSHPSYDCSSYVYHAILGSGIKGISKLKGKWPGSTSSYKLGNTDLYNAKKYVDVGNSNMYPADICVRNGHVLIFVGVKAGMLHTLEAMGSDSPVNGFHTRESLKGNYYVLRLKDYYVKNDF